MQVCFFFSNDKLILFSVLELLFNPAASRTFLNWLKDVCTDQANVLSMIYHLDNHGVKIRQRPNYTSPYNGLHVRPFLFDFITRLSNDEVFQLDKNQSMNETELLQDIISADHRSLIYP